MKAARIRSLGGVILAGLAVLSSCNSQEVAEKAAQAEEEARAAAAAAGGQAGDFDPNNGPASKTERKPENPPTPKMTTTESGLQYVVLQEGSGPKPGPTDEVTVHYHGTLQDGTVFDSSVDRNAPATFRLNQVIKGWTEGVQLMSPGSKFKFVIPPDLAYGEQGAGGVIGPNETLTFEVELISVQ